MRYTVALLTNDKDLVFFDRDKVWYICHLFDIPEGFDSRLYSYYNMVGDLIPANKIEHCEFNSLVEAECYVKLKER